jgi:GT2 family glycosyltransferase
LLRTEHFLSPNQARNMVLPFVDTEFIAFVDYDTETAPGWLDVLEDCARRTGASIVGPAYLERRGDSLRVHMVGGETGVDANGPNRWFHEGPGLELANGNFAAQETGLAEFHCMLVRRDVFDELGPLDDELRSVREHSDLCLAVRKRGGTIFVEPSLTVTYAPCRRFRLRDREFWIVRWSDAWARATLERFETKWQLSEGDPASAAIRHFVSFHRRYGYRPWITIAGRVLGPRGRRFFDWIDPVVQRAALARHRARLSHDAARVVHAASWVADVTRHA